MDRFPHSRWFHYLLVGVLLWLLFLLGVLWNGLVGGIVVVALSLSLSWSLFRYAAYAKDDGRVESVGSRFAKGLGSLFGHVEKPALPAVVEEIDEPSPEEFGGERELVELQIALPPEYQPHANVFEQFLFSIGYSSDPVAFEVIGTSEELVVQLTTSPEDAGVVRQQLKAFFPEYGHKFSPSA